MAIRRISLFLFLSTVLGIMFISGCNPFSSTSDLVGSPTAVALNDSAKAEVKFNIILPPSDLRGSLKLSELRLSDQSNSEAYVTFKIIISNPGNRQQPSYTIVKKVLVSGDSAQVTFDNIPARSVVGLIKIDDGHINGFTDFIGAKDLQEGKNELDVVPAGSGMNEEIVAKIVQAVVQSPDLIENAPEKLVSSAQTAAAQVNLKNETAFNEALSNLLEQIKPPTYVYLVRGDSGEILRGYKSGELAWTRTANYFNTGELWNTDISQMEMFKVLRQGLDGFGFVSFKHKSYSPFAIVRIDTATGNRAGFVANSGICQHAIVLSDGSIIVGGTNDDKRCPTLFRWNGTGEAQTESNSGAANGLMWARYFTEFPANSTYPSPSVEGLTYDGQILLCTVRDPANNMQRTFRIDITTGTGDSGFTGTVTNSLPFVTLTSPAEAAKFTSGSDVTLTATAYDVDGAISKVEFFHNENKLGEATASPYTFTLQAPAIGNYSVFAKAFDDKDASRESNVRTFEVVTATTVEKPSVAVSSPTSGQTGLGINPQFLLNVANGGENHKSTDWEVYSAADLAADKLVWSSVKDTTNLTAISPSASTGTFANSLAGKTAFENLTTYWVRARARNSEDDSLLGDWSGAILFTTVAETNVAPQTPALVSPAANATSINANPQLQATAFYDSNTKDVHAKSDWEIYTGSSLADSDRIWSKAAENFAKTGIIVNNLTGTFANNHANETGLLSQTTYYARVRYYDDKGTPSEWSALSSFTTRQFAAVPSGLSAVVKSGGVTLTWNSAAGATSYNVYQATATGVSKTNSNKTSVSETNKDFSDLTNGTTYYFKIASVDSEGNESALSEEISATPIGAPANLVATPADSSVTLTWQNVEGVTYNVYVSTNAGQAFPNGTKYTSVTSPHTVSALNNNTTYYFVVTSNKGSAEIASEEKSALPVSSLLVSEFALPANYSSVAYPNKDANASLAIANFGSTSEVYLVLANRSASSLTPSWSATRSGANIRAAMVGPYASADMGEPASEEHKFHLMLRQLRNQLPTPQDRAATIRPSVRAVSINDQQTFRAYTNNNGTVSVNTITATCRKVADISGTSKKVYFFLDNIDLSKTGVTTVIDGIAAAWANIYATNRTVFGAEPEGTFNGLNVNDFYILLSSKIYTAGYFYSGDFYPSSTPGVAYSNEKKLFNLQYPESSTDLQRSIDDLSATMAHEFQHMIHFYQKRSLNDPSFWLDEAMSGYAEQANGFRIENGKNQSKALQAQKYMTNVARISVNEWHGDNDSNDYINAHYGKAYLFGTWLAQNYGSSGSVQSLLSVQKVEEAAVEAFTGETFDKTFARFVMALRVNNSSNSIYGINGLDLNATYSFGAGWADVTLSGPATTLVDFSSGTSGSINIAPYAAAYIKITGGTGTALNISATLPTGISLFQLKKN